MQKRCLGAMQDAGSVEPFRKKRAATANQIAFPESQDRCSCRAEEKMGSAGEGKAGLRAVLWFLKSQEPLIKTSIK